MSAACNRQGGLGVAAPNLTRRITGNRFLYISQGSRETMMRQSINLLRRVVTPAVDQGCSIRQLSRGTVVAMAQVAKAEASNGSLDAGVEAKVPENPMSSASLFKKKLHTPCKLCPPCSWYHAGQGSRASSQGNQFSLWQEQHHEARRQHFWRSVSQSFSPFLRTTNKVLQAIFF